MDLYPRWFSTVLYLLFTFFCRDVLTKTLVSSGEVLEIKAAGTLGGNATVSCLLLPPDTTVTWMMNTVVLPENSTRYRLEYQNVSMETDQDGNRHQKVLVSLVFFKTRWQDHGLYSCQAPSGLMSPQELLNLTIPTRSVRQHNTVKAKLGENATLNCMFQGFNLSGIGWQINGNSFDSKFMNSGYINQTHVNGTLERTSVAKKDNGTYNCGVMETIDGKEKLVVTSVDLLILDVPQISLDYVKAVSAKEVYFNWTVSNGNMPITGYVPQYRKEDGGDWQYINKEIKGNMTSFVMGGLQPNTSYNLRMMAKNSLGPSQYTAVHSVTTLLKDPHFVPVIVVNGFTMTSVTINWSRPPPDLAEYVQFFTLEAEASKPNQQPWKAIHQADSSHPYMFGNLTPATTYTFKVRACSELTMKCGNWSMPETSSTMDGIAGPPAEVNVTCHHHGTNYVSVSWLPPLVPNGKILRYSVELNGTATFKNNNGRTAVLNFAPIAKHSENTQSLFDKIPSNTNFTVSVSAVTRTKKPGEKAVGRCSTLPSPPAQSELQGVRWEKVREYDGRWMFQLHLPRVSERNGAICCYRVVLVRMKNEQRLSDMPTPEHLDISSYEDVHNVKGNGAYIAEIFTSDTLQPTVILGDESQQVSGSESPLRQCTLCARNSFRHATTTATPTTTTSTTTTTTTPAPEIVTQIVTAPAVGDNDIESSSAALPEDAPSSSTAEITEETAENLAQPPLKKNKKKKRHGQIVHHKQPYSGFSYDQNLQLDNSFYENQRILHQNRWKQMEQIEDEQKEQTDDDDSVNTEWLQGIENDSFFQPQSKDNYVTGNRLYLGQHKVITREVHADTDHEVFSRLDSSEQNRREKSLSDSSPINSNERKHRLKIEDSSRTYRDQPVVERTRPQPEKSIEQPLPLVPGQNVPIFDGKLDRGSNYTGFVELLVFSTNKDEKMLPVYSDYFSVLNPGPDQLPYDQTNHILEIILKVVIACVGLALLLVVAVCVMHAHGRQKAVQHGVEMHTLQSTIRNLYQGLRGGRHQLVSHSPPDIPAISKDELLNAYNERSCDTGYGFQHEFEMLPDSFPDRTMESSESKENMAKNRYPDIKAYDQTRVKLSRIENIPGSDYINANVVLGYKERKKFICAQGPTDTTVEDFWRMIWEQNVELVVMLTNLEEYSKVKCSKYWPDAHQSHKVYNTFHVHHVSEKRYSDYIIRELKINKHSMTHSNSNSQIIEINGVKKNGVNECSNGNGTASGVIEERIVKQYHFLMWKDFVAPEHPHAILKFIKRVGEACGAGRTALVHCSAGVGRTGTLVALDCLTQQLDAEGHVAIFNTICDLRRQRNFLVQSLKQYVFVYRALLEHVQYGDTEIPASRLKTSVDRLRQTAENSDTCAMEAEFEKIKQPLVEVAKACAAGRTPESIPKNRSEAVVPYDHNRVILAPVPTRDHSTYINASFIEGYDNSESYIIAQDPLPSTIGDFWRMVSEQEITTIVMLSELGDGKCPRYWDDDEIQYEHITVNYLQSESCPYYARREFQVTNTKNQERSRVTQLQYHGWPTVSGQVPEVTRGLIELVGQAGACPPAQPPLLVHCSLGTERSSMFVALSILITQLRTERRVDVSSVTRKLRTQRQGCLDTFQQYEFLHRAIVNYAELHNLLSDS